MKYLCLPSALASILLLASMALPANPSGSVARAAGREESALERARAAAQDKDWSDVAEILFDALRRSRGDAEIHGLLGQALVEIGRPDEAAHWIAAALSELPEERDEAKQLRQLIQKADPLARKRDKLFEQVAKTLGRSATRLFEDGHVERALDLAVRVEPIARGDLLTEIRALLEEIRARDRAVDLDDAASGSRDATGFPLYELESKHYELQVNLEPEVAQLVADTMDDIFSNYVQVYFGGDWKPVDDRKATIRIFGTWDDMMATWGGDKGRQLGGWWSPSEWKVTAYDTRSTSNPPSLDSMLQTLYHEASHQFMTMRARGGSAPSWLNEGTASFFEGSQAMADHRVLWPQAASGRLLSVTGMIKNMEDRPRIRDVIGYDEPGSYETIYYPFGWGLVYFLQEYEDEAFDRPYREPYLEYLDKITKQGGNPLELFERVVIGPDSPQPFESVEAFEEFWAQWLLEVVLPSNFGDKRSALRMQRARDYIGAADTTRRQKGSKKARRAREVDLLERAFGQVEWVRTQFEEDEVDGQVLVLAADLYERLEREESTAPILERLLDQADAGELELSEERYADFERRLHSIDRKNAELRSARSRAARFGQRARGLIDEYDQTGEFLLRQYTFARQAALVLQDDGLLPLSVELRERARAAGLLLGSIHDITGSAGDWITIFEESNAVSVETGPPIAIESTRPAGRISTRVPVRGEYEVRCTLGRRGKLRRSTTNGVVVSGTKDGDWIVVGVDGKGQVALRRLDYGTHGGVVDKTVEIERLRPGIESVDVELRVHCFPEGRILVDWEGADEELEFTLSEPFPATAYVGAYAKDGQTEISDLIVEIYP